VEVAALCLGAAPADDLPVLISRIFHPSRVERLYDQWWELTLPLQHRLSHDEEAVAVLRDSLVGAPVSETTPFFATAGGSTEPGTARSRLDDLGRRLVVTAFALRAAGQLGRADFEAAAQALRQVDPRLVVVDPTAYIVGPLRVLGTALIPGPIS
jgi:hypothetical protein